MPDVVLQGGNAGQWNVTVTIYQSDGTTLATVYADAGGSVSGANPLPKQRNQGDFGVDNAGNWTCYLPAGDYQVGVHPAGGSETKTPFTVAAAPVPDVGYELTSVYGSRADGDVPVWNAARGRLEWGAGGGGGGTSPVPVVAVEIFSEAATSGGDGFIPIKGVPANRCMTVVSSSVLRLGAGGVVAYPGISTPDLGTDLVYVARMELGVVSLDGTQERVMYLTTNEGVDPPLPSNRDALTPFDNSAASAPWGTYSSWVPTEVVGTDLTWDSENIVTTAGGIFYAWLFVKLEVNPE